MIDLGELNPRQREAVTHGEGPLLVLAGAGSGKTRVITYRIAWLIGEKRVDPRKILAVTFTNKAAGEMVARVGLLVAGAGARPVVGTFHATSLRQLRRYADRLGFSRNFTVYDTADQMALVRRVLRDLNFNEDAFPARGVLSRISKAKNELVGPAEFEKENVDFFGARIAEAYRLYQKRLKEFDAMDFDDLIGNYVVLLRSHPDVRDEIRSRIEHLLIDEYQDTNRAQYVLVKLLAGERGNVTAVGDEDQSIYRFRGADINNILNFESDFPGAKIVKLEQNYRSTGSILDAATGVVSNNVARKGKRLFTEGGAGDPVRVVTCETEREEAQFAVTKILSLRGVVPLREFAVLFRTNAQSRPFEEELLGSNLPYTVVGGVKFYERAEIRDLMAYLRLTVRPNDDPAIERVINTPARGIGDVTLRAIADEAAKSGASLWTTIEGDLDFLPGRASKAVREFREIVHDLQRAASNPIPELFDYLLVRTGYRRMLAGSNDPQDEARVQNIDELMNSAREFHEANPAASLGDYIDSVTLMSDVDSYDAEKGVTLMTLHAAKGLEFRIVFLAGMEEGLLPHSQSADEVDGVEEERRLCYVGMTRAREQLYCLHVLQRRIYGQFREQSPSPFLGEIPAGAREEVVLARQRYRRPETTDDWGEPRRGNRFGGGSGRWTPERSSRPQRPSPPPPDRSLAKTAGDISSFFGKEPVRFDPEAIQPARAQGGRDAITRGAHVRHAQFGKGVVLKIEGTGDQAKLTVYFDRAGTKKFIAKFAQLEKI
jgi:DNA helicase II / ATP-dependent DNA helicase PcrA